MKRSDLLAQVRSRGIQPKPVISPLKRLLDLPMDWEVEASIGTFDGNRFFPGVQSLNSYLNVVRYFREMCYSSQCYSEESYSVVEIAERFPIRRIIQDGITSYEKKVRDLSSQIDDYTWGWRVSASKEEVVHPAGIHNFIPSIKRQRKRESFVFTDKNHKLYGFRYDFTIVEESGEKVKNQTKYEIELERIEKGISPERLQACIFEILRLIQSSPEFVMSLEEKRNVIGFHNKLFGFNAGRNAYRLFDGYWAKPISLSLERLLTSSIYSTSVKYDGLRKTVLFYEGNVYLISPPFDVTLWLKGFHVSNGTVMEGEYMDNKMYVFDMLFNGGKDVRHLNFKERYTLASEMLPKTKDIMMKKFFFSDMSYDAINEAINIYLDENPAKVDGIILQPDAPYKSKDIYKWKPISHITIDFLLRPVHDEANVFWLRTFDKGHEVTFYGNERDPIDGKVHIANGRFEGNDVSNNIVEMAWNPKKHSFVPYRLRYDRPKPNAYHIIMDIWRDINDPINIPTLRGDTMRILRYYHNNIKRDMLSKYAHDIERLMDWGSGRGGDLGKWMKMDHLRTVYAIEPNQDNLEEFRTRLASYETDKEIKILNTGAENTTKIHNQVGVVDAITSFFSLTFFGKDEGMYKKMLKTIDVSLAIGGLFIGIVQEGNRTKLILEENNGKYVGPVYYPKDPPPITISQVGEFKEGFGDEILIDINDETSMVKQQTEWLFYFHRFVKDMEAMGFRLELSKYLDSNHFLPMAAYTFSYMNKAFTFVREKISELEPEHKYEEVDGYYLMKKHRGKAAFLHAVLDATDKDYAASDKKDYVNNFRSKLEKKLTPKMYSSLADGVLKEVMDDKYGAHSIDKMREIIVDPNKRFVMCLLVEFLSRVLKINIIMENQPDFSQNHNYKKTIHIYEDDSGKIYSAMLKLENGVFTTY
jgi:precorrin-6B methylase 2